jgi:mono/diheme cytochrome c family protein
MKRHEILEMMAQLQRSGMRAAYEEIVTNGTKRQHGVERVIGQLLTAEIAEKEARSIWYQMGSLRTWMTSLPISSLACEIGSEEDHLSVDRSTSVRCLGKKRWIQMGSHTRARWLTLIVSCLSVTWILLGQSLAQMTADPKAGRQLALSLCTGCHNIDTEKRTIGVVLDGPNFTAIANRPGQSAEAIAGAIVFPHPPMPQTRLTRTDIANLSLYIMSLRTP